MSKEEIDQAMLSGAFEEEAEGLEAKEQSMDYRGKIEDAIKSKTVVPAERWKDKEMGRINNWLKRQEDKVIGGIRDIEIIKGHKIGNIEAGARKIVGELSEFIGKHQQKASGIVRAINEERKKGLLELGSYALVSGYEWFTSGTKENPIETIEKIKGDNPEEVKKYIEINMDTRKRAKELGNEAKEKDEEAKQIQALQKALSFTGQA